MTKSIETNTDTKYGTCERAKDRERVWLKEKRERRISLHKNCMLVEFRYRFDFMLSLCEIASSRSICYVYSSIAIKLSCGDCVFFYLHSFLGHILCIAMVSSSHLIRVKQKMRLFVWQRCCCFYHTRSYCEQKKSEKKAQAILGDVVLDVL